MALSRRSTALAVGAALAAPLLASGCGGAEDTAGRLRDCTALAADVARAGLSRVPSQEQAERAADAVHERLSRLSPKVHDPAVVLHDRLHAIEDARADGDAARAAKAAAQARDAAADVAAACGLPVDRFVGGG